MIIALNAAQRPNEKHVCDVNNNDTFYGDINTYVKFVHTKIFNKFVWSRFYGKILAVYELFEPTERRAVKVRRSCVVKS